MLMNMLIEPPRWKKKHGTHKEKNVLIGFKDLF